MLSHKAKYALKALMVLAKEYGQGPVLISDIAQREGVPRKFLELILLELKNQGLLQSKKGKGGGYQLARPPQLIPVGEVLRSVDGPIGLLPCVSKTAYARCEECHDERTCGIRLIMKDVRDSASRILDMTSLADLVKRSEQVARGKEGLSFTI
jgi:Rrf2 family protein